MNQFRIKIEYVVDSDLNVAQVRKQLRLLESTAWSNGPPALTTALQALVSSPTTPVIACHSASYNTHFGRKPESGI